MLSVLSQLVHKSVKRSIFTCFALFIVLYVVYVCVLEVILTKKRNSCLSDIIFYRKKAILTFVSSSLLSFFEILRFLSLSGRKSPQPRFPWFEADPS